MRRCKAQKINRMVQFLSLHAQLWPKTDGKIWLLQNWFSKSCSDLEVTDYQIIHSKLVWKVIQTRFPVDTELEKVIVTK